MLYNALSKYELLLEKTLGTFKNKTVDIEQQPDVKP